jgi:general stress protein YciG
MPNTPDRGNQQPGSQDPRKRQQLNDKALQGNEEDARDDEEEIEAPGEQDDDDATPLRTDQGGGETGEDEDEPEGDTQVNSNPGNFANDREKASEAGRKGGQR